MFTLGVYSHWVCVHTGCVFTSGVFTLGVCSHQVLCSHWVCAHTGGVHIRCVFTSGAPFILGAAQLSHESHLTSALRKLVKTPQFNGLRF